MSLFPSWDTIMHPPAVDPDWTLCKNPQCKGEPVHNHEDLVACETCGMRFCRECIVDIAGEPCCLDTDVCQKIAREAARPVMLDEFGNPLMYLDSVED